MINRGFTLLEVLIALLAAAIISIMSFDFLSNTVFLKDRIDKTINSDAKHANAMHLMRLDLIQAVPFKMKDQNYNNLNVSLIGSNDERILTFVSLNSSDISMLNSNLRRVIYTYKDNNLARTTTLANNENIVLSDKILLENIENLSIAFGDEITDLTDYFPTIGSSDSINFPTYIILSYELENQEFNQILGFYR